MHRFDTGSAGLRLWDSGLIGAGALFLLVPLAMITLRGVPYVAGLPAEIWHAAGRSLMVALGATGVTLAMTLALAHAVVASRAGALLEWLGLAALAASPLVIGTGLFLLIQPLANPRDVALLVTMLVNAGMAMPFALRLILPALRDACGNAWQAVRCTGTARAGAVAYCHPAPPAPSLGVCGRVDGSAVDGGSGRHHAVCRTRRGDPAHAAISIDERLPPG